MVEKFKAENSTQVDLLRLVFEIPTYSEYGLYYMALTDIIWIGLQFIAYNLYAIKYKAMLFENQI